MTKVIDRAEVKQIALKTAEKYGLNSDKFVWVVKCESSFNHLAVGDGGHSFGAVQIHLPSHPEITREQALDPYWAIEWAGKEWKEGRERKWTCARMY